MLFITVRFVIIEFLVFCLLVIGAIALSHLGLLIVGRIDALLSPENRRRSASSASVEYSGEGSKSRAR
jgi:hypothetical protein